MEYERVPRVKHAGKGDVSPNSVERVELNYLDERINNCGKYLDELGIPSRNLNTNLYNGFR